MLDAAVCRSVSWQPHESALSVLCTLQPLTPGTCELTLHHCPVAPLLYSTTTRHVHVESSFSRPGCPGYCLGCVPQTLGGRSPRPVYCVFCWGTLRLPIVCPRPHTMFAFCSQPAWSFWVCCACAAGCRSSDTRAHTQLLRFMVQGMRRLEWPWLAC